MADLFIFPKKMRGCGEITPDPDNYIDENLAVIGVFAPNARVARAILATAYPGLDPMFVKQAMGSHYSVYVITPAFLTAEVNIPQTFNLGTYYAEKLRDVIKARIANLAVVKDNPNARMRLIGYGTYHTRDNAEAMVLYGKNKRYEGSVRVFEVMDFLLYPLISSNTKIEKEDFKKACSGEAQDIFPVVYRDIFDSLGTITEQVEKINSDLRIIKKFEDDKNQLIEEFLKCKQFFSKTS